MSDQHNEPFTNLDDRVETLSPDEVLHARRVQRHCEEIAPGLWETNRFP